MKKYLSIISFLLILVGLLPGQIQAASASMYLSPSSLNQTVGDNFTLYVGENSGGNSVNAFEGTVNLPTGVVAITGAGTGGSLCSIWVQQPTVSGSSVSFKCGIPGGTTSNGTLVSISLRASTAGFGTASISGARVLAGPGDNVTGGTSGANITISAASSGGGGSSSGGGSNRTNPVITGTGAPSVTSNTNSDPNAWSKNNSPSFSWNKASGVTGFSFVFDQSSGTVPGTTSSTTDTSVAFPDRPDGVYYFHIRANSAKGWSGTTHFRVQIDKTQPTGLEVVTDPKVEADKRPMVSFNATDATSGIDHYEIKLDEEAFKRVSSPYTPDSITSGDHVFTVRAFDKAGNVLEGEAKIKIKDIPIPKITQPTAGAIYKLAQQLDISGTANPGTAVDIFFDGVSIAKTVKVNDDGTWKYIYQSFIMPGKHQIIAVAVKDGIQSKPSTTISFRIDPSAINVFGVIIPTYVIFIALIVVIMLLVVVILWLFFFVKRKYDSLREKLKKRRAEVEEKVHKDFDDIERKIRKDVQVTYEGVSSKTPKEEHQLEDKIDKELESTEREVVECIDNETKDL